MKTGFYHQQMLYQKFTPKIHTVCAIIMVVLFVFITVKSLTPSPIYITISHFDKITHIAAYLVLGLVCLPALPRLNPVLVSAVVVVFGAGIEILQGVISTGRTPSVFDGFANALGVVLALAFWLALSRPSFIKAYKNFTAD